jgi:hypothetical protein
MLFSTTNDSSGSRRSRPSATSCTCAQTQNRVRHTAFLEEKGDLCIRQLAILQPQARKPASIERERHQQNLEVLRNKSAAGIGADNRTIDDSSNSPKLRSLTLFML